MQNDGMRNDAELTREAAIHSNMIRSSDGLYEKKIIQDREFPIEILINRSSNLRGKKEIFFPHWHEHIELHYILSGTMEGELDQRKYVVRAGDLAVFNGNVLHSGFCTKELNALVIIFRMEDLARELADRNIVFQEIISQDAFIRELMTDIYEEYERKEIGYWLVCKGKILQLISYLTRNFARAMLTEKESMKHMKKLERLNMVRQYIERHYTETITNRELAELIHLSEDRFNHLFKECMGVSPLQYMNEIRLDKAMHLLKSGRCGAAEAAEMVGFSDYNYFGRIFRRKFGVTPTQVK